LPPEKPVEPSSPPPIENKTGPQASATPTVSAPLRQEVLSSPTVTGWDKDVNVGANSRSRMPMPAMPVAQRQNDVLQTSRESAAPGMPAVGTTPAREKLPEIITPSSAPSRPA